MRPVWQTYTPQLDVWSGGTTPTLGTGAVQRGAWIFLQDLRLVKCEFQIVFGSSSNAGSGNYIVSLPIPAQVSLGGTGSGALNSQHDRLLGFGSVARTLQSKTVPVVPNVADAGPSSINGQHRNQWCQLFAPWQVDSGSSSITSAATTKAVTFTNTMAGTPSAADIDVQWTSGSTNLVSQKWLTSVSTTGFTVNINQAPGSTLTFDWKIKMDAAAAPVTDQLPWAFTTNDVIQATLLYEPAF